MASKDMIRKGITLRGIWHYNLDYPNLLKVIGKSRKKLDKFITRRFPMSKVQDAWELQTTLKCGKVILDPGS